MNQDELKKAVALEALKYVEEDTIVGVGTGSTANYFIDGLATMKHKIEGTVASSVASAERLKKHGIPVFEVNTVREIPVYVDGADEANPLLQLIKGGGGAGEFCSVAVSNEGAIRNKGLPVRGGFCLVGTIGTCGCALFGFRGEVIDNYPRIMERQQARSGEEGNR